MITKELFMVNISVTKINVFIKTDITSKKHTSDNYHLLLRCWLQCIS